MNFSWIMNRTVLKRDGGACMLPRLPIWFYILTSGFGVHVLIWCIPTRVMIQDIVKQTQSIPDLTSFWPPSSRPISPLDRNNSGKSLNNLSDCLLSPSCATVYGNDQCHQHVLKNTFACKHLMTLKPNNRGRTGNQMFQVAALLGTASYHGYTAVIDSSMKIADIFDLPNLYANTESISNDITTETLLGTDCCKFNERVRNISHLSNWTLAGYLQSWKYFEGSENFVRNAFRLKDPLTREARSFIKSKIANNTVTINIHIRRGDFIKINDEGFTVAPIEYIKNATEYFRNKYERVHFFAVSDDKEWCRKNLRWANVTISPFQSVGLDMALMVESDHVIVTSGTFGWWGAWLCGGETVYWTGYPGKGSWLGNQTIFDDFYPRHWIGMS